MHARVVYLGWEKVSCLERCPQFRGVLIERFLCITFVHIYVFSYLMLDQAILKTRQFTEVEVLSPPLWVE